MPKRLTRRTALQLAGAAAVGLSASPSGAAPLTSWEPAGGWPTLGRPRKILEIFLRGGASLWSSFLRDPSLGGLAGDGGTEDSELTDAQWSCITGPTCGGTPPLVYVWPAGNPGSFIGKAASPLVRKAWDPRSGTHRWLSRFMRIVRVGHHLAPHEAAIPYAATGSTIGRPNQSGLGAAVWHAASERGGNDPDGLYSIILRAGGAGNDRLAANYLASYGEHGAQFRPPILPLGDIAFYDALDRTNHTSSDPLKAYYRNRYDALMRRPGDGALVRSDGWSTYYASLDTMQAHHDTLHTMFDPAQVTALFGPIAAVDYQNNRTRNAINTAIALLADTNKTLEHIAVVDGGVLGDYDTHNVSAAGEPEEIHNGNIWNVCDALASNTNALLDNGIAVLIHSEFGRREEDTGNTGTEHHPRGYANVVISDLIPSPLFVGEMAPDLNEPAGSGGSLATYFDGTALDGDPLHPTDVHVAMTQLAGIDPILSGLYDDDLRRLPGAYAATDLLGIS